MQDLIEAFTIFLKYGNPKYPTICEHDVMTIAEVDPAKVSQSDKDRLKELGFYVDEDEECFRSTRFGSA